MEMEKINENTIKVSLENDDLTERGITVLDLLGNQKEIESFFYSILDEVDTEHEFRETDAVTFQLMPNLNGLELFITKMDPDSDEEPFSPLKELEKKGKRVQQVDINDLGDADDITDFIRKQLGAALEKSESKMLTANDSETKRLQAKSDYLDDQSNMQKRYLVSFANFEDFIQ
ncbi:MAG: adaptor protein MecA, partial [Ligilactobacillus agilis]|nr:adaptor protein MecA [Ligilactobacillus agilis]